MSYEFPSGSMLSLPLDRLDRRERLDVLFRALDVAPEVEPIGWTLDEWQRRRERGDPFVAVVEREGVPLR